MANYKPVNNFSNLMNYLLAQEGYGRLESTTEPDVYRLAQFINDLDPETGVELKSGLFTLNFNCMPQKFLKSGEQEIEIDDTATILNPTMFDAFAGELFSINNGIFAFDCNEIYLMSNKKQEEINEV